MLWEEKLYGIRIFELDSGEMKLLIEVYNKTFRRRIKILKIALENARNRKVEALKDIEIKVTNNSICFILPHQSEFLEQGRA